jgi:hypothetical protein
MNILCLVGGTSSVLTQFQRGWLVVMKIGSLLISSLSALFHVGWDWSSLEKQFPRTDGCLINDGFLKDDGGTVGKLIYVEIGFVSLSCDSCWFCIQEKDVRQERFPDICWSLQNECVDFCDVC